MSQTTDLRTVRPMALVESRYEMRAGEPAQVSAPVETLDFLLNAKTRRVTIAGAETSSLVVGPSAARDRILVAPSLRAEPGEYAVTLSATSETGEERQATMDVVVKPRLAVPNGSTRAPVVLLNGWQEGFYNSCPISASSADTFGSLAQYLVSDGVPVVYLFDNCVEDPNQTIEVLGSDLATFLNTIKYDSGAQVPQIDLVAFSMGGLIARAYLAGLQASQAYLPPATPLVGRLVLIATPNFGSFVTANYVYSIVAGSQSAELIPGSSFLWNLATWNQRGDDLRGVSTIAVVGNAGTYTPSLSSATVYPNASDGLVTLTSASVGFAEAQSSATRVVPYCHIDPGTYTNATFGTFACNAVGIANVTSTSHLTGQIVRSFLAGNTTWSTLGTSPTADPYLSTDGGMFFAMVNAAGSYVSDMTSVVFGTVTLANGGDTNTIFYTDLVSGTGTFVATSTSLGTVNCGSLAQVLGYSWPTRCKIGPVITSVTPLTSTSGRVLTAGTTITINGKNLGAQCSGCQVQAYAQGSGTAQVLSVTSWQSSAISVKLPSSLTGLSTLKVTAAGGADTIGIMAAAASTIAATPASLAFTYTLGGTVPSAQSIQIANTGTGTLSWTATASDSWLSLSAASGTAPSPLSVSVSPAALSVGTYNGSVQISSTSASNSPVSVAVTLTVAAAPPLLAITPATLAFQYAAGGAVPAAQNVSITNAGAGALSWTASADSFWIGLSATSGSAPSTLSISVNPANLAAGTNTGMVTVTPTVAGISPVSVAVTLTIAGTEAAPTVTGVANAGSFQPAIASGAWVSIFGTNLSQRTYTWQTSDFVNGMLPTSLQGVSVTINGLPAYVEYISPTQINVLAPDDATVGPVAVQVTTAQQAGNSVTVQKNALSPAFLTFGGKYVAALHADYSLVGAPNLLPGAVTTPAKPGETILLYGAGFGPTNPAQPAAQLVTTAVPLAGTVQITIGGVAAPVTFSGLVESGLYQFNVTVPNLANGDAAVVATIGGVSTETGVSVTVQQ